MKCKNVLLFFVATLCFLSSAYAQNVFGFKAGMQLVKMTGFNDAPNSFLPTVQAKGIAILPLSDEVALTPSLGYSGKGFKWTDLEFTDPLGNPIGSGDIVNVFHYVQLTAPISYKIAPDENQEFYFGAGPYFSYAVSGEGKIRHAAVSPEDDSWDLFEDDLYKRTDAGIVVEISSKLKKKFLIAFNADIGLSNISNGGGGNIKHLGGGLSIGYLFANK